MQAIEKSLIVILIAGLIAISGCSSGPSNIETCVFSDDLKSIHCVARDRERVLPVEDAKNFILMSPDDLQRLLMQNMDEGIHL